jgi:hypothetical protein
MRLSFAWSMAEEPWWGISDLQMFKLRYSIGTAGNNPLFSDQYETYLQNAGTERIFKQDMGNTAIVPEKVTEQEMGIDMSYKNRFGLELNYVRTYTEDAIRADTILSYTGFDTQVANLGDLLGHTYEATLEAEWFNRNGLRWSSNLVADHSRVRIQNYPRRCLAPSTTTLTRECEGYVFGEMWGSSFVRDARELSPRHAANNHLDYFQVNDDGLLVPVGPNGSWTDGRWGDTVNVDGISYRWGMPIVAGNYTDTGLRNGNKVTKFGQGLPKVQLGIGNNVVWNKWDFFMQVTGQIGGMLYNRTREDLYDFELHRDVDQAGKPEYAKKPSVYYTDQVTAASGSSGLSPDIRVDWFAEDAAYAKISEMQVRYRFDQPRFLRAFGARQLSLAVNARNLYTFTDYTGYDPEAAPPPRTGPFVRVDQVGYPKYRTFSLRAQVIF